LRADSIGSVNWADEVLQVQFTGIDDYAYTVEASSNLVDWSNGIFNLRQMPSTNSVQTFYRSVLME